MFLLKGFKVRFKLFGRRFYWNQSNRDGNCHMACIHRSVFMALMGQQFMRSRALNNMLPIWAIVL